MGTPIKFDYYNTTETSLNVMLNTKDPQSQSMFVLFNGSFLVIIYKYLKLQLFHKEMTVSSIATCS
jgi:hypothetical protein